MPNTVLQHCVSYCSWPLHCWRDVFPDSRRERITVRQCMGGAAAWAGWAMAHPKFWLGGPQCIWPHQ